MSRTNNNNSTRKACGTVFTEPTTLSAFVYNNDGATPDDDTQALVSVSVETGALLANVADAVSLSVADATSAIGNRTGADAQRAYVGALLSGAWSSAVADEARRHSGNAWKFTTACVVDNALASLTINAEVETGGHDGNNRTLYLVATVSTFDTGAEVVHHVHSARNATRITASCGCVKAYRGVVVGDALTLGVHDVARAIRALRVAVAGSGTVSAILNAVKAQEQHSAEQLSNVPNIWTGGVIRRDKARVSGVALSEVAREIATR